MSCDRFRVDGLTGFGLNTNDVERLAGFYVGAFDCSIASRRRLGKQVATLMGSRGAAQCLTLKLGCSAIDVIQFDEPGRPYAPDFSAYDLQFQHFAIVVADMDRAFERLSQARGWSALSTAGPQRLPESSGNVTAFKFRDPDGHPLELLSFPPGRVPAQWQSNDPQSVFLGIDHSAIGIARIQRSIEYYESLGLHVSSRTVNQGMEQQRLDGVQDPIVDVISMEPPRANPHLELLCYRNADPPARMALRSNDIAATRLLFQAASPTIGSVDAPTERVVQDPDGHFIQIAARDQVV